MTNFEDTCTDSEFRKNINNADSEWMSGLARSEPDLEVEAFTGSIFSRLLGLFGGSRS
jgi:hypothetical protein